MWRPGFGPTRKPSGIVPRNESSSEFIRHVPCGSCGSRDNNALYSDGHTYCFGCGGTVGAGRTGAEQAARPSRRSILGLIHGDYSALAKRKITEATCQHFGYFIGEHQGSTCQVANYHDADGVLVAQKIRRQDKTFAWLGDQDAALPFGSQCWPKTGKQIVVTEGELDALSMSQVQGNKYPVVSIGCGAGPQIKKYIAKHAGYLKGFEKVIIMFDNDEKGSEAAKMAAQIIGSKAFIADIPVVDDCKDASDLLVAGKAAVLIDTMWKAAQFRPEGLVTFDVLKDKTRERPQMGLSWPWPNLSALFFGIQKPYIYTIGAATGAGKTDVLRHIITHLVTVHHQAVGIFSLEEEPQTTALGLASKVAGRLLNTPDGWDDAAFESAWSQLQAGGKMHLFDSFGMNEWDTIKDKIEYLYHTEGVEYFVVDHLTALASGSDDDRVELERIMSELSSLVTKLKLTVFLVSHLATPEGKPHEEGGRVMIRHMKGSRAIGQWSHGAIGLERNQQADDQHERHTTAVRVLKARGFGWNVGKCSYLAFDEATGLLNEIDAPGDSKTEGFKNESKVPSDF